MDDRVFDLLEPEGGAAPFVVSAPHGGTGLPPEVATALQVDPAVAARLDDGPVHALFADARALGATVLVARLRRVCVDLNRHPREMAPDALSGAPPGFCFEATPRARCGLGVIPTRIGHLSLHRGPIPFAAYQRRIETMWRPYHAALAARLAALRERFGTVLLLDVHSMPSNAAMDGRRLIDACVGDRFGRSADAAFSAAALDVLREAGLSVARNVPFAGGYVVEAHADPTRGVHALQIELRRALFATEEDLRLHAGAALLRFHCRRLVERLLAVLEELRLRSAA